jgi:hypothetical protein
LGREKEEGEYAWKGRWGGNEKEEQWHEIVIEERGLKIEGKGDGKSVTYFISALTASSFACVSAIWASSTAFRACSAAWFALAHLHYITVCPATYVTSFSRAIDMKKYV